MNYLHRVQIFEEILSDRLVLNSRNRVRILEAISNHLHMSTYSLAILDKLTDISPEELRQLGNSEIIGAVKGATLSRYVNQKFYCDVIEEIKNRIESKDNSKPLGSLEALLFYMLYRMAVLNQKEPFFKVLALINSIGD